MRLNSKRLWQVVITAVCLLMILFVFSNSATPAAGSEAQSSRMLTLLQGILDALHIPVTLTVRFVRKLAHFAEYAVLGGLLTVCARAYTENFRRLWLVTAISAGAVAVCDELIQAVTPGRSCQASDMLLDFAGAVFGAAVTVLLLAVCLRKNKEGDADARQGGQRDPLRP